MAIGLVKFNPWSGGTKGPVNRSPVTKGCILACCGDHRSKGFGLRRPFKKSVNASRFCISDDVKVQ